MEEFFKNLAAAQRVGCLEDLLAYPKYLQIETSSACNARCVMCPIDDWTRAEQLMSDEVFGKIVDDLRPHVDWIEMITLQAAGEPLIDKKLEQRIAALKGIGVRKVVISCNGSLLTAERAAALIASGIDEITFSFDGATKETYEAIRRRLSYDAVVSNIKQFLRLRDEAGAPIRVRLRMTVFDKNIGEFNKFLSFWNSLLRGDDRAYGKIYSSYNYIENYELPLCQVKERKLMNSSPCSSLWTSFVIFTDGRVSLCCGDYNAVELMGDVRLSSIEEIWRGEPFTRARAAHAAQGRNGMPRCVDCNIWYDTTRMETPLPDSVKSLEQLG